MCSILTQLNYPTQLTLQAIGQRWDLTYEKTDHPGCKLIPSATNTATLLGQIGNPALVHNVLSLWLKYQGNRHLIPWLNALSHVSQLPFTSVSIRGQKSRWGSCSSKKQINLNYFLLFLPYGLAKHVLLHELCHTKHLNHSKHFWELLEKFDTNCATHRRALREADRYLPPFLTVKRTI